MMSRRRLMIAASGALLLAGLTLGVYRLWPAAKDAPAGPAQAAKTDDADLPAVSVAQVKSVRLAPQASFPGTVMSRNDSKLAADVAGRVEWVAEVGTAVKQGDRMGIIRFGSRVDVFIPTGSTIRAKLGDVTAAGVTILAELPK